MTHAGSLDSGVPVDVVPAAASGWGPVNPFDQNSFPVVGAPGSGKLVWVNLKFALSRQVCNSNGCRITDTFSVRITVNPGAVRSKISITSLYSPNSGNFTKEYLSITAINKGVNYGTGNTGQLNTAKGDVYYTGSIAPLNGTVLTTAVALWVNSSTLGLGANGAKTHDAHCAKKPSNVCKYSREA